MYDVDTLSRLEWFITQHFTVHRIDDVVVIPFDDLMVFASTTDMDGHAVALFDVIIGSDLQPSPALYRWVATKGALIVGSLYASITDDGLVDVRLRQSAYLAGLDADTTAEIVQWLVGTGERLQRDARDLFA